MREGALGELLKDVINFLDGKWPEDTETHREYQAVYNESFEWAKDLFDSVQAA